MHSKKAFDGHWRKRDFDFIATATDEQVELVAKRAMLLIGDSGDP
jgi:hypothetical protein